MAQGQDFQLIWVCEFAPIPDRSTTGGWDWYYSKDVCLSVFLERLRELRRDTHQIGMYSVAVPSSWDYDKIQAWLEDSTNVIPCALEKQL